jgi:hypothetical protein
MLTLSELLLFAAFVELFDVEPGVEMPGSRVGPVICISIAWELTTDPDRQRQCNTVININHRYEKTCPPFFDA